MLLLLGLALCALAIVAGAAQNPETPAQISESWSMGVQTALTALVSGLITAGLAVPVMVLSVGRWLGTHTEKILANERSVAAVNETAAKAHHRIDAHVDAHARGEFDR